MDVKNRLTGVFSGVEDQSEIAVGVLCSESFRGCDDLCEKCRVPLSEVNDIGEISTLGNDEQVNRSLRGNVTKRDEALVFPHDVRRDLAIDDLAENAHGSQCIRVTIGRAGR